ncbi:MAG TPA: hypothetical protein VI215_13375 [Bacteroidota bacterium]|jgi:hypothetical protein
MSAPIVDILAWTAIVIITVPLGFLAVNRYNRFSRDNARQRGL